MVSVVVIAYNVEKYIGKCIESIIDQTYSDIEIIVVDSDSTDGTTNICKRYADCDSRIVYVHKESQGPGAARTSGMKKATGKYIMFVDGDDWLEDTAVAVLLEKAERWHADITLGDIMYVQEYYDEQLGKENATKVYSKIRLDEDVCISGKKDASVINKCRTFTWGKLYSTNFLRENKFVQKLFVYEDLATVPVLFACAKKIVYVNKPIYNYLRNRTTSLVNDKIRVREIAVALKELYKGFYKLKDYSHYKNELKRLMWGQVRFVCLKHPTSMETKSGEEMSLYEELSCILKTCFDEFIQPEQCDVRVINAKYARKLIENIMISHRNVEYITDKTNSKRSIKVLYGNYEKEYVLDNISEKELMDESRMWDIVDDIFQKMWC